MKRSNTSCWDWRWLLFYVFSFHNTEPYPFANGDSVQYINPVGRFGNCGVLRDATESALQQYNKQWKSLNDGNYYLTDRCFASRPICNFHPGAGLRRREDTLKLQLSFADVQKYGEEIIAGKYVSVLGPATSFGIGARTGFGDLLSRRTGMPVLHFGEGGAGPGLLYQDASPHSSTIRSVIAQSAIVIVVVMAGRSSPNSAFPVEGDAGVALIKRESGMAELSRTEPSRFWQLANESLDTADRDYQTFSQLIRSQAKMVGQQPPHLVLLWLSQCNLKNGCMHDAQFPQYYVGKSASERLGSLAQRIDAHLVDASYLQRPLGKPLPLDQCVDCPLNVSGRVCTLGEIRKLIQASKNACVSSCASVINEYYATDEMHENAADLLEPIVRKALQGRLQTWENATTVGDVSESKQFGSGNKQALPNAPCANKLWAIVMAAMIVLVMRKEMSNRGRSASFLVAFMALLFVFAFTSLVLQSSFLQHCSCFENSMEEKVEAIHNTAWRSNNKIETESKMKSMELAHLASHDSAPLKHVHQNDDSMVHRSEVEEHDKAAAALDTTRAVVHMGPHKTGTTTIQVAASRYSKQLRDDGYEIPFSTNRHLNQETFASCFLPHGDYVRERHPCDSDLLLSGSNIASRGHNMFISAEDFARIDSEGIRNLSSYLSHWDDVIIVVFYRRYYSWLASFYNQIRKARKLGVSKQWEWERSILDFISTELSANSASHGSLFYTSNLYDRLVEQFSRDQIIVIDSHNESLGGPDEALFCHAMPNAAQTCNAIQTNGIKPRNMATNLDYSDLVYGAKKAGLVEINVDDRLNEISQAAQKHQEGKNMTSSSFPRICLAPDQRNGLLRVSLEIEKKLFPETFELMEDDLRSDFVSMAESKLCKLDTKAILAEQEWLSFFRAFSEDRQHHLDDGKSAMANRVTARDATAAPRLQLKPVDDHFAWFHIPKTGTAFVNVLYHYACRNAPSELDIAWYETITADSQHQCGKYFSRKPFLTSSYNQTDYDFHQSLNDAVYEHNKGKLIGMIREPKKQRISMAKHKFFEEFGNEDWLDFTSSYKLPANDTRLSTYLKYERGYQTGALVRGYAVFRYSMGNEEMRMWIDKAKRRLTEGFQYIGITNRFDESVCLFFSKFIKPGGNATDQSCPQVVFDPINTADDHQSQFNFTSDDWKYFESYDDVVDREIYNHALQLFEADLARYGVTKEACVARGCWPRAKHENKELFL